MESGTSRFKIITSFGFSGLSGFYGFFGLSCQSGLSRLLGLLRKAKGAERKANCAWRKVRGTRLKDSFWQYNVLGGPVKFDEVYPFKVRVIGGKVLDLQIFHNL